MGAFWQMTKIQLHLSVGTSRNKPSLANETEIAMGGGVFSRSIASFLLFFFKSTQGLTK